VLAFVDAEFDAHPELGPIELARRIKEHFGIQVLPKSIACAR